MRRFLRPAVQICAAGGLTWLLLRQDYAAAARPYFTWSSWFDPLAGLAGALDVRWLLPGAVVLAASLVLAIWRGRIFCGWLCPVGFALDLLGTAKRLIGWPDWQPGARSRSFLAGVRWSIFGVATGMVLLGASAALSFDPFTLWPRSVRLVLAGSFPWSLAGVAIVGLLTFPRLWCRFVCPAGSAFNLISRLRPGVRGAADCRRCLCCLRSCPMRNIDERLRFGRDCLECGRCARVCPDRSLRISRKPVPGIDESRRNFLAASAAGVGVLAMGALGAAVPIRRAASARRRPRLLRPPGALEETALAAACTRCGQCLSVCPVNCLVPAGLEAGLAGLGTPRFVPRLGRCMFCKACGFVCPTGALAPLGQTEARLGTAEIDHGLCLAWQQGTRCLLCVETCPTMAISIDSSQHPVIDTGKCIGCGSCEAHCPVEGSAAIVTCAGEIRRR